MAKPWSPYRLSVGPNSQRSALRRVHHVTHVEAALRILADGHIARSLIFDESILNETRTTVVWMSPNVWFHGSRYGNVQFSFDFADLVRGRKLYWVEFDCELFATRRALPRFESGCLGLAGSTVRSRNQ